MDSFVDAELQTQVLEQLPNPLLIKDADLRYVWVNPAFCDFFGRGADEIIGKTDSVVFADRQASQCNGGDLRVLESGEVDHAPETVFSPDGTPHEIITRKSRIILSDGRRLLVGVLHDVTEVSQLNEALTASEAKLHEQAAELRRLSVTDPLTDCLNRRGLHDVVEDIDDGAPTAVLVVDLDHFKAINDQWGHEIGDDALRHVADLLRAGVRPGDTIARVGGEEFVVLLQDCPLEEAVAAAERLRSSIEASPMTVEDAQVDFSISAGLVHSLAAPADVTAAMRQADELLYLAKDAGRNCVEIAPFAAAA